MKKINKKIKEFIKNQDHGVRYNPKTGYIEGFIEGVGHIITPDEEVEEAQRQVYNDKAQS